MTPWRRGLTATMLPGVLPSISLASSPMALILLVSLSNATTEGSFRTTPFPLMYTKMLAVPKSIPISVHCIRCPLLMDSTKALLVHNTETRSYIPYYNRNKSIFIGVYENFNKKPNPAAGISRQGHYMHSYIFSAYKLGFFRSFSMFPENSCELLLFQALSRSRSSIRFT